MADNVTSLLLNDISKVASGLYFGRKHMGSKDMGKSPGPSCRGYGLCSFYADTRGPCEFNLGKVQPLFQCDNTSHITQ